MKVGVSGTPPYPTPDGLGSWGGNLGPPMAVAANESNVFAAFQCVESSWETGVQLMDPTGKIVRRFGTFLPWDGRHACAMEATNAYLIVSGTKSKQLLLAKYDLDNSRGKILAELPAIGMSAPDGRWKGRWRVKVEGLAVDNDRVYVALTSDDKLLILDKNTGKLMREVAIPSPRGVAVRNGRVYLLSDRQLLALDGPTIVAGLDDPSGLAVDAAGNFYIAERGAAQQVRVVAPTGKTLRMIGLAGGRPREGHFNPAGMLDPRGICIGPGNRLWVAEANEDFQRLSVWDAATGKLVNEFFNMRIASGEGQLTPDRSEMLFTGGPFHDAPGISAYKLDVANGTWAPSWRRNLSIADMHQDDVLLGNNHVFEQIATSFAGRHPYLWFSEGLVKADNGRTYAIGGEFSIYLFDPKTCETKLAAFINTHRVHKQPDGRFECDYDTGPNNWLTWADLNGDGKMATNECIFTENVAVLKDIKRMQAWELEKDLSVVFLSFDWTIRRLRPRQVLDSGVPVYDWSDVETVVKLREPQLAGGDGVKPVIGVNARTLHADGDGWMTFGQAHATGKLHLGGIDGEGWWASRNWRQTPLLYRADGTPNWLKLGRRAPGRAQPGEMYHPFELAGHVDGFVFVPDTLGNVWAWTDTGLYLGRLYNDPPGMNRDSILVELVGSYVYKLAGKLYSFVGDHGVNVHEIKMPPLTPLAAGKVTVTPAMAAAAKPWDPDGPPPGVRPTFVAQDVTGRTVKVDAGMDGRKWGGIEPQPILLDGAKIGDLRVMYDAQNLYLFYNVLIHEGFVNTGAELPYSPFSTGAYVDFCLSPQWDKPQHAEARAGDVRVILTKTSNELAGAKDYQMGFWQIRKGGAHPQTITSPAAQCHFDDIASVPNLRWATKNGQHGYTVEVAVPWVSLGIEPRGTIGFDASIGVANESGIERARAAHWAGETEGRVVDRPGSAELKPATWGTLKFAPPVSTTTP